MKTENKIKAAISYLDIILKRREDAPQFIGISTTNNLLLSGIKPSKIIKLLEHTGKVIDNKTGKKDRCKYFSATTPVKMLDSIYHSDNNHTLGNAADRIKEILLNSVKLELKVISRNDIPAFYSNELEGINHIANGSCMRLKPQSYFKIYTLCPVKMYIMTDKSGTVHSRAMLWSQEGKHYLDRIYTADIYNGSSDTQSKAQYLLFTTLMKSLKLDYLEAFNSRHLNNESGNTDEEKQPSGHLRTLTSIEMTDSICTESERFPYADTFTGYDGGTTLNNDDSDYILDSTCGGITDVNGNICDCCGSRMTEDEGRYSEIEEEYLCGECSVYIEEREDVCREENATYNRYSGHYIFTDDID